MEYNYSRFDFGKFGGQCGRDEAKAKLQRRKMRLRGELKMQKLHKEHEQRVKDIRPHPDIVATRRGPSTPATFLVKDNMYKRKLACHNKIDMENAMLLARIRDIYMMDETEKYNFDPSRRQSVRNRGKERIRKAFQIAIDNCLLARRLQKARPTMETAKQLGKWYRKQKKAVQIGARYPPYADSRICAPFERLCSLRAKENPRPIVFLDIEVENIIAGRVFIELRADIVPMSAENFRSACTGDRGVTYRCAQFSKIFPDLIWQGGYLGPNVSMFGEAFPEENYHLKHDSPGIVSMVSYGPNTVNTEFRITAMPLPILNGRSVVIGKVISGMEFLEQVTKICKLLPNGSPRHKVIINDGGETTLDGMENIPPAKLYSQLEKEAKQAAATIEAQRVKLEAMAADKQRLMFEEEARETSICSSYSGGEDDTTEKNKKHGLEFVDSTTNILSTTEITSPGASTVDLDLHSPVSTEEPTTDEPTDEPDRDSVSSSSSSSNSDSGTGPDKSGTEAESAEGSDSESESGSDRSGSYDGDSEDSDSDGSSGQKSIDIEDKGDDETDASLEGERAVTEGKGISRKNDKIEDDEVAKVKKHSTA